MWFFSTAYDAVSNIAGKGVGLISGNFSSTQEKLNSLERRVHALSENITQHVGEYSEYNNNQKQKDLEFIDREIASIPVGSLMTEEEEQLYRLQKRVNFLFSVLSLKKRIDTIDTTRYELRPSKSKSFLIKEIVSRINTLSNELTHKKIKSTSALKELDDIQYALKHVFKNIKEEGRNDIYVRLNELLYLIVNEAHNHPEEASAKKTSDIRTHGVENIGNTCYINSIRAFLKESKLIDNIDLPSSLKAFKKERPSARSLKSAMGSLNSEYKSSKQQDAMEAMIQMMGKIDLYNQKTSVLQTIYNFFRFIASIVLGSHTKFNPLATAMTTTRTFNVSHVPSEFKKEAKTSVKTENESILSIGMSNSNKPHDVQNLLKGYFKENGGEDAYFETPTGQKYPRKSISCERSFQEAPKHLIMSFNRFYFDKRTGTRGKIQNDINGLNEQLSISGKHFESRQDMTYQRYAAIIHAGVANAGHYYAIVKAEDGKYYKFDDDRVTEISRNNADNEFKKAYLVYYRS